MISIIIPSYNSEHTIKNCLHSLFGQLYDGKFEVILVDSSDDRTPHIVKEEFPDVKLIHLPEKTDPGTARNLAIKEARGEIIAFFDSDCVAAKDWLNKIQIAHNSSFRAVGGSVANGNDENNSTAWAGYISEFREFVPDQKRKLVTHIPTCNISVKKDIFDDYGFFKGEYYPQEDLVFNFSLSKNGVKILFEPQIKVYHHHRTCLKDYLTHQKKIGRATSMVLKKIDLEGSFIARHPAIAVLSLPFLPVIKFFRTCHVFWRYQPEVLFRKPFALVIFAMGLIYWMVGFAQGIQSKALNT